MDRRPASTQAPVGVTMGKRDLNDQHRDGVLDLDDVEPLPTPELDLNTAEDLAAYYLSAKGHEVAQALAAEEARDG